MTCAELKQVDVANAHTRDLNPGLMLVKYMASCGMTKSAKPVFCLVHAPDPATAERVHREAHGEIANAIIPVDLAAVEAFLGRIGDPRAALGAPAPGVDAGLRAVMFTDIVGSIEMTARLGDSRALDLVRVHDARWSGGGLDAHGGREVKHTGDGIVAPFDEVSERRALRPQISSSLAAYNMDGSESLSVRIGIDAGEPVTEHNDLFGTTVQLASRLCHEAEADSIFVSRAVRELCEDDAAQFAPLSRRQLKGFAEKTPVFRFQWRS